MTKLYVASSWRNEVYPAVLQELRDHGHECYDFRNPAPGDNGFAWDQIDEGWRSWSILQYRQALRHPIAEKGFRFDKEALDWAQAGVLVMPSGRSAHIEAGYLIGQGKPVVVLLHPKDFEADLMYKLTPYIAQSVSEALGMLDHIDMTLEVELPPR